MKIKLPQLAKKLNVSERRVLQLSEEELASRGWVKIKEGRSVFYEDLLSDSQSDDSKETLEDAKRRKMIADADLAEQKASGYLEMLRHTIYDEVFTAFSESFAPLKTTIAELKLDTKNTKQLQEIISVCIEDLQNHLKNI